MPFNNKVTQSTLLPASYASDKLDCIHSKKLHSCMILCSSEMQYGGAVQCLISFCNVCGKPEEDNSKSYS